MLLMKLESVCRIEKEGPWNWEGWLSVRDLEFLMRGGGGFRIIGFSM